jgi:oxygen-dependent protoporphyrinogen oxidase
MNGRFIRNGRIETYPLRVPMPLSARASVMTTGIKVAAAVARYARVVRQRPGESAASRQQRIYDFENERSFADFVGDLPADAAALFKTTVTRLAGEMDEISAGAGISSDMPAA